MKPDGCVITGDIIGSRSIDNWSNVFKKLDRTLKEINREFANDILVDFKPTVGDEFQGILIEPKKAYIIYNSIKSKLPVGFYCGVGIGLVERPLSENIGTRGSAFYRARNALELCKKRKRRIIILSSDTPRQIDDVINTLLYFIEVLGSSWTKRQQEVVSYYRAHINYTYEQLGKHFGISKQSVSQILKGANWSAISQGEAVVNKLLDGLLCYEKTNVKGVGFTNENEANMLYMVSK
ncbi:MAG: SatD family protein [Candidatus Thermoplasmatota archaeon]